MATGSMTVVASHELSGRGVGSQQDVALLRGMDGFAARRDGLDRRAALASEWDCLGASALTAADTVARAWSRRGSVCRSIFTMRAQRGLVESVDVSAWTSSKCRGRGMEVPGEVPEIGKGAI